MSLIGLGPQRAATNAAIAKFKRDDDYFLKDERGAYVS